MKTITTLVSFKLLDNENTILAKHEKQACFSKVTYNSLPKKTAKIIIYSKDDNTVYDAETCRLWIELIASFGFDVSYEYDELTKIHNVIIPIKGNNTQRAYLHSILMFARCLTEYQVSNLIKEYNKLVLQFKLKTLDDKFKLLQFAHQLFDANSNHQIRDQAAQSCFSLKEFFKKADITLASVFNTSRFATSDLWEGRKSSRYTDFKVIMGKKKHMNVFVVGGNTSYANWFPIKVKFVKTLRCADLVVFSGGEDVDPQIYNEPKGRYTYCNLARDLAEKKIYQEAVAKGLFIVSICRGSQLSCVMNGGRLVQHQANPYAVHEVESCNYGKFKITSTHHQAAYPFNLKPWQYKLIAWTNNISDFHLDGNNEEMHPTKECEIVYYPASKNLAIQGHCEFASYQRDYPNDLKVVQQIFSDFINDNI